MLKNADRYCISTIDKYYIWNTLDYTTSSDKIIILDLRKDWGKGLCKCNYLIPSPEIVSNQKEKEEIKDCLKSLENWKLREEQKKLFRVVYMCENPQDIDTYKYVDEFERVTNKRTKKKLITEFDDREKEIERIPEFKAKEEQRQKEKEQRQKERNKVYRLISRKQNSEEGKKLLIEEVGYDEHGKMKTYSKKLIENDTHPIILIKECRDGIDKIIELRVYEMLGDLVKAGRVGVSLGEYLKKLDWVDVKLKPIKTGKLINKRKACFITKEKNIDKFYKSRKFKRFLTKNANKSW